jgi:hypothetical protein
MTSLLSRAADFDCGRRADGTLDLACVCQSRPFKTEAKRAVGDVCHDPADIGAARKWAIARCTASKWFCVFPVFTLFRGLFVIQTRFLALLRA